MGDMAAELRGIAQRGQDLGEVFWRAAQMFREAAADHFDTQGSGSWARWSDSYAARGVAQQLLVKSGELRESWVSRGHQQNVSRVDRVSLDVGSKRPTGTLHRTGASSMPVRDPMPPVEAFEPSWIDGMHAYLSGQDKGRFGL